MTEREKQAQNDSPESQPTKNNTFQQILSLVIVVLVVVWGIKNPSIALRILAVMLGFGGIVMIHELGHFIVAKLGGIKVEAFSIGFPPVVLGIRKLKKGWRFRLLPKMGAEEVIEEGDNETEYQIGLIPVGGFVKMLGQSDTGAADASDDPRSYANRPVSVRIATVSAGVIFNAISAVIIFMILFMNGIDLKPAMVGRVIPNSPAYDAGLKEGDEIVAVNGERFVDFESVLLAPALAEPGEPISFIVKDRETQMEEEIKIIAEERAGDSSELRYTGISPATTLTIEPQIKKAPVLVEEIYKLTGLYPDDEIKTLNGKAVSTPWDFAAEQAKTFQPQVEVGISRKWSPDTETESEPIMTTVPMPMEVAPVVDNFRDEYDLANFCSMVPRLKVKDIYEPPAVVSLPKRIATWFKTTILRREQEKSQEPVTPALEKNDIIIKIADQQFPNFEQLRNLVKEYKNKDMPVTVLRKNEQGNEQMTEVLVHPKTDPATDRVLMGIAVVLDMDAPIVAQVLDSSEQAMPLTIPAGSTIISVDGEPVSSFYEIAQMLQKNAGKKISLDYIIGADAGGTAVMVPQLEPVHAQGSIAEGIPFQDLTHEFKATNPIIATKMGLKKAWQFVSRSLVTLGRLFQGSVPVKALSGPVGIISMTYQVAGASLDQYLYFLGLISSCLAVMNLLPLPVLDGGHIVILLIEKITGKPINERLLAGAMYAGMALLLVVMLWITYQDIIRIIFGR